MTTLRFKMVEEAPKERVKKVYVSESFKISNEKALEILGAEYEIVSDNVFLQMSDTKTPQGILAIVKMLEYSIDDLIKEVPLIAIVENLLYWLSLKLIFRLIENTLQML